MNKIQRIWQKVSPNFLLVFLRLVLAPKNYKERRRAVLSYFKNIDRKSLEPEIREGLNYLRFHKFSSFPYKWTQKYDSLMPEVFRDEENHCFYSLFDGKKMYFPKHYTLTHVIWSARAILKEQDTHSPHLYLTGDFNVEPGSIIMDAGVAEGNFALTVVDEAKRLYLIECDQVWMDALRLTFAPWKEKVVFIEKYLSDEKSDYTTSIDDLLKPEEGEQYFIKLDIEGYEQKALAGMKKLVSSVNHIKLNVCTYHKPGDFEEIKAILQSYGFNCHVSEGYVLYFQMDEIPSFRKVLIRAEKK
jgi:hypothetical protein